MKNKTILSMAFTLLGLAFQGCGDLQSSKSEPSSALSESSAPSASTSESAIRVRCRAGEIWDGFRCVIRRW